MAEPQFETIFDTETQSRRLRRGDFLAIPIEPRAGGDITLSVISRPTPEFLESLRDERELGEEPSSTPGGVHVELFNPAGDRVASKVTQGSPDPQVIEDLGHRISTSEATGTWNCQFTNNSSFELICRGFARFPRTRRKLITTAVPIDLLNRTLTQFLTALGLQIHFAGDDSFVDFSEDLKGFSDGLLKKQQLDDVPIRGMDVKRFSARVEARDGDVFIILKGIITGEGDITKGINLEFGNDKVGIIDFDVNRIDVSLEFQLRGAGPPDGRFINPIITPRLRLGEPENLDDALIDLLFDAKEKAQKEFEQITIENFTFVSTVRKYLTEGFIQLAARGRLFQDVSTDGDNVLIKHARRPGSPAVLDLDLDDSSGVVLVNSTGGTPGGASPAGAGGVLVSVNVPPSEAAAAGVSPDEALRNLDKIKHIVVLMMENRSFDHMLGSLSLRENRADVSGLTRDDSNSAPGVVQPVKVGALSSTIFEPSPFHESNHVKKQIADGTMSGFLASFLEKIADVAPDIKFAPGVMGFHTREQLPLYYFFADHFTICDHWFCSYPGPTWPNRFCALTGRTPTDRNFESDDPRVGYVRLETIFDFLNAFGRSWAYYEHDVGFLRMFDSFRLDVRNVLPIRGGKDGRGGPDGFFQRAASGDLPEVTFIDPNFVDVPFGRANDDLAPTDLARGQRLICRIYNALRNSSRWSETLFVITYDEHGGFYDHMPPPGTTEFAKRFPEGPPFDFDTVLVQKDGTTADADAPTSYGPRVPAFIISPLVPAHTVSHIVFDHTSIVNTIMLKFRRDGIPGVLGRRAGKANHLGALLTLPEAEFRPTFDCKTLPRPSALQPLKLPKDGELSVVLSRFGMPLA